jgi:hypothetical protein
MPRLVRRIATMASVAAFLALGASADPVAAECTELDLWPSFRAAARSAKTIVIGHVTEGFDEDSAGNFVTFEFRTDETLRGRARDVMTFQDVVRSGLPLRVCPADSILRIRIGDRLALAFGARYEGVSNPVTAIAFLNRKPNQFLMPGMERLTADEVRFMSSLPQTDTEPGNRSRTRTVPWIPITLGVLAGLVSVRLGHRRRYPEGRWPSSSRPSATNAVSGTGV